MNINNFLIIASVFIGVAVGVIVSIVKKYSYDRLSDSIISGFLVTVILSMFSIFSYVIPNNSNIISQIELTARQDSSNEALMENIEDIFKSSYDDVLNVEVTIDEAIIGEGSVKDILVKLRIKGFIPNTWNDIAYKYNIIIDKSSEEYIKVS